MLVSYIMGFLVFDVVLQEPEFVSGMAAVSDITLFPSRPILLSLARSCGKMTVPNPQRALRNSVGVTPVTRRKTFAKWLGLV